jgi:hypothetical protein
MNSIVQRLILHISKELLGFAAKKAIGAALPQIYEKIDITIPVALFNGAPPTVIKSEIGHVLESLTKRKATLEEIELVASLYNPIANAKRTQRKRR